MSQERAEFVRSILAEKGLPIADLVAVGVGASVPLRDELTEDDRAFNRCVTFTIIPSNGTQAN